MAQVSWADIQEEADDQMVTENHPQTKESLAEQERRRLRIEKRKAEKERKRKIRQYQKGAVVSKAYRKEHEGEWIRVENNFPKRQKREFIKRKTREYQKQLDKQKGNA